MAQTKIKAGLFEGIIGNGTDGYFLMSNGDGTMTWSSVVINPTIVSIAYPGSVTAADPAGGETITVTGTGFKTGATVTVGGTTAPAVSYVSDTQITFTTPAKAAGDYDIVVTNTDTGSATFINGISYNGIPSWTTPAGSLGTFASDTTISTITLQASEPDAGTITFNITNGALPTGLSLTGADIDGTTSLETADTLYTFTVTATDDESQATPRTFTITVTKQFINTENFTINTYTGNGSTQSIEGKIDTAASFNGSSYISTQGSISGGQSFSISLWCYLNTSSAQESLFTMGSTSNNGFFIYRSGQQLALDSFGATQYNNNTFFTENTWQHLTITYSSGTNNIYLDGSFVDTFSYTWNINASATTYLGAQIDSFSRYLNGKLDQVRIFDKAISSSEVTTLYGESNTSTTKSTTDIFEDGSGIALYEFEEGAKDTGTTPYGTGAIDSGQSAVFNGSSSYIDIPSFSFGSNNITVSMWVNPSDTQGSYSNIFDFNHSSGTAGSFTIQQSDANTNQYKIWQWNGSTYNETTTVSLTANQWNHLAFSLQSTGSYVIYVDGISALSGSNFTAPTSGVTETLNIGRWLSAGTPSRYFNGKIDQVRIYSSALSALDIEALVSETNVPTANLVAHYKLDGNANDETTNYNGTASNVTYSDPAEFPLIAYNGTPTNVSFVGTSFQPDLVWIKSRGTEIHVLTDSVRGVDSIVASNDTYDEATFSSAWRGSYGQITSFDSNGFSISNGSLAATSPFNVSGVNHVAWCWKAGGSVTPNNNTQGTITSTVSANPDAGFSIVSYTGTGSTATVGHGLSAAPELIFIKNRNSTSNNWAVAGGILGSTQTLYLNLINQIESYSDPTIVNTQTSTTFTIGADSNRNGSGANYIAYCFHSVDDYQKVGSYTGNGSTTGPTITTGFRPRFLVIKRTDTSGYGWYMMDSARGMESTSGKFLFANGNDAEGTLGAGGLQTNFNGFQIKDSGAGFNANGGTYIYLAIA